MTMVKAVLRRREVVASAVTGPSFAGCSSPEEEVPSSCCGISASIRRYYSWPVVASSREVLASAALWAPAIPKRARRGRYSCAHRPRPIAHRVIVRLEPPNDVLRMDP